MKKLIKIVIASTIILGFNVLAAGGGAFGGTISSVAHNNIILAAGGGAFGGTT